MIRVAHNRRWLLARRPQGVPGLRHFEKSVVPLAQPGPGDVLLRTLYVAMDPAIRGFMGTGGYGSIAPGEPVRGMVLGEVIESHSTLHGVGDVVFGFGAWSDYVTGPAAQFHPVPSDLGYSLETYTHVLGTIGLTAWYGLFDIAGMAPGDCVLISAAAGAVGSLVGQMARIKGASKVVGIAGGLDKCRRAVERYGFDACIDYKTTPDLSDAIGTALPAGIDVHFESVGGAVLEAALDHLAKDARIALCGMIAGYNAESPQPGPRNLWNLVVKTAQIRAFRVTDILGQHERTRAMLNEIDQWIRQGKLVYDIDVREGFDSIPDAFACLFTGAHAGRLVVRLAGT